MYNFEVGDIVYIKTGCTPCTIININEHRVSIVKTVKNYNSEGVVELKEIYDILPLSTIVSEKEWLKSNNTK